ncbi:CcmD family protein [Catalinimonas alkaloidigena]|nr:CcmD family protein [Catalinimonas alkaloidigena]
MKKLLFLFLLLVSLNLNAQTDVSEAAPDRSTSQVEMADTLRQSGKIYVVVAVVVVLLSGVLVYLVRLDRRVDKLEKDVAHHA